jgi:FAD/FMN-containing dehydrogenase
MELSSLLNAALPSKVLTPESAEYSTSNSAYFTTFNSAIKPAFIVQPTSSQDVSALMKALYPHLLEQKVSLAVRGTGHTPFAGASNVEGGVTIDLRGIKGVKLNKEMGEVDISVGESWGSVYAELEKHGMTTPGGRVARVGVGGLVLGGESGLCLRTLTILTATKVVYPCTPHATVSHATPSPLLLLSRLPAKS